MKLAGSNRQRGAGLALAGWLARDIGAQAGYLVAKSVLAVSVYNRSAPLRSESDPAFDGSKVRSYNPTFSQQTRRLAVVKYADEATKKQALQEVADAYQPNRPNGARNPLISRQLLIICSPPALPFKLYCHSAYSRFSQYSRMSLNVSCFISVSLPVAD